MEPFSLLKFWRNPGGADISSDADSLNSPSNNTKVDVRNRASETDEETDEDDEDNNDNVVDDDSFFDLVFSAPDCYNKQVNKVEGVLPNDPLKVEEHEDSINNLIELESPLKAEVFSVDSNSKPLSPISLLKSAPNFRVFLLGFRKPKSEKSEANEASKSTKSPKQQFQKSSQNEQSKRFTVKCKVEEVPIGSLFSRDNSLRSKLQRERSFDFSIDHSSKPLPKDVPMYLKLIKPLYIRASKRYTADSKTRFTSDQFSTVSPLSSPAAVPSTSPKKLPKETRGNRGTGFKVVSKHLGKSRSASSTAGTMSSPANRRDDSLLLQHDGIQSAILHCKRSYNSTAQECSAMLRSSQGKSMNPGGNLSSERSRCSTI